ncbi:hypothetical protein TUMEXPCC7403_10890 [Tumidithrix helvetica PCC 7403]
MLNKTPIIPVRCIKSKGEILIVTVFLHARSTQTNDSTLREMYLSLGRSGSNFYAPIQLV